MVWGRWGARVACMAVVGMCALLGPGIVPSSASTLHPTATVGMPLTGQWVSNYLAPPPYTNDPEYPAVKPANNGGDWSENEYAPEGTPIILHVTSPDGPVTFHWLSSTASCDGNSSKMDVFVNGTRVGWIFFAHFRGGRGTNTSDPQPTNGMTLGTMHDFDPVTENGCNDGPHVHVEMYNYVNYSCWTDNGQPGITLDEGAPVGMLGSPNTAAKQPCASSSPPPPPPPGPTGYQVVSGSGSTALYCPNGVNLGSTGTAGGRGGGKRGGSGGAGGSAGCGSNGGAGRNGGSGTNKVYGGRGGAGGNGACPPERYVNNTWYTADGTQTAPAPPCNGTGANGGNGGPGGQAQGSSVGGPGGSGGNGLFAGGGTGGNGAAGGNGGRANNTPGGAGGNGGNGGSGPGTTGGNGGQGGNGGTSTGAYGGNGGRGGDGGASQPGGPGAPGGNGTSSPGANGANGTNGA
jgi:hypothetical protein